MDDNTQRLNDNRLNDLKTLKTLRDKENYFFSQEQIRNFLFIYANSLASTNVKVAIEEFLNFANKFDCRSNRFLSSIINRIPKFCSYYVYTKQNRYKFSNEKIIELLNISKEEQEYLFSIVSDENIMKKEDFYLEQESERRRIEEEIEKSIQKNEINDSLFKYKDPILIDNSVFPEIDDA